MPVTIDQIINECAAQDGRMKAHPDDKLSLYREVWKAVDAWIQDCFKKFKVR